MGTTTELDAMAVLAKTFPDWHVWRGRSGPHLKGWYATRDRHRKLSAEEVNAGLARTVAADDANELRDRLRQQQSIEQHLSEERRR